MTVTALPAINYPQIPSKWDIIPIHASDRSAFKRCRRYWDWNSPSRQNLVVRADIHGVVPELWFGTGIHWCLQNYYTPGFSRDPVESWKTWFNVQWRGGTVTEDWLDLVYDLKPRPVTYAHADDINFDGGADGPLWSVRGLEDIIPNPDHDLFDELFTLGVEMMTFYKKYATREDNFEVVVAEHQFSVPIWDYDNNCILKAIDRRENSPNYGKYLEVHARGRQDGVYRKPNEKMGIIDHKTLGKLDEDIEEKLDTDEQCTTYLWAAEVEAQYYDLPHKGEPLEEVIYNMLRKAYPKPPTTVRGGMFSIDRQKESTTHEMLMAWIEENLYPGMALDDKHQAYVDYVRDVGDDQFIVRKFVRRNRHQLKNAGIRMYHEAMDMLDPEIRIYPNLRNDFSCMKCAFRPPCLAKEDGGDHEMLIRDNYVSNRDR